MNDSATPATPVTHGPELWRQLQAAAQVLAAVRAGRSASDALEAVPAPLRPGVQAQAYAALRQLGRAEALRELLAPRKPAPAVDALLCLALALASGEAQDYDAHTLVNQAVEAAKRHGSRSVANSAGFLNACLRRFLRERADLLAEIDEDSNSSLVARWNHPRWWIARLQKEAPEHWQAVLATNNRQPPMTLRVNIAQGSVDDYLASLQSVDIAARRNGAYGITLERPVPVQRLPGFAQGRVSVQDAAAQLAAPLLLDDLPDSLIAQGRKLRILDACAAPGGKTAHLLELIAARGLDAEVIALDIDPERCRRIEETLQRTGLQARVLAADAGKPASWRQAALEGDQLFDAILLDAPCTASGIVQRHPDVRWLRRESDISSLAAQQARLLAALWPLLTREGRLLYCTCSVFKAEGVEQVQAFLAHNKEARPRPAPGHLWPLSELQGKALTENDIREHDGFYYALLAKEAG